MRTSRSLLAILTMVWASAWAAPGSGTLTLGSKTFEFEVEDCYLESDSDPEDRRTLYGTGETDDGKIFRVFVHRILVKGMLSHDVSLQIVGGDVYEASRISNGQIWIGNTGIGDEPLIVIDGSKLSAEDGFSLNFKEDPLVQGRLEAACPQ